MSLKLIVLIDNKIKKSIFKNLILHCFYKTLHNKTCKQVKIKITNGVYTAYRVLLRDKILKKHQNYPYISIGHGDKQTNISLIIFNYQIVNFIIIKHNVYIYGHSMINCFKINVFRNKYSRTLIN